MTKFFEALLLCAFAALLLYNSFTAVEAAKAARSESIAAAKTDTQVSNLLPAHPLHPDHEQYLRTR